MVAGDYMNKLKAYILTCLIIVGTGCSTVSSLTGGKDLDLKQALDLAKNNKQIEQLLGQYGVKLPNSEVSKAPEILPNSAIVNISYRVRSTGVIISPDDLEIVKWVTVAEPFPLAVPQSDKYVVKVNAPISQSVSVPTNGVQVITNTPVAVTNDLPALPDLDGPDNAAIVP